MESFLNDSFKLIILVFDREIKIVVFGLDNSGKSTLLANLNGGRLSFYHQLAATYNRTKLCTLQSPPRALPQLLGLPV